MLGWARGASPADARQMAEFEVLLILVQPDLLHWALLVLPMLSFRFITILHKASNSSIHEAAELFPYR